MAVFTCKMCDHGMMSHEFMKGRCHGNRQACKCRRFTPRRTRDVGGGYRAILPDNPEDDKPPLEPDTKWKDTLKKLMGVVNKVLRLTRHPASEKQLAELRRIYGSGVEVVEVAETVPDVERVKAIVAEHGADVLEAVLPMALMAKCVDPRGGVGIPVIRAITVRHLEEDGRARFEFSHYERIIKVEVVTERL